MVLATLLLLIFQKKIENYALSQLNSYLKTEVYVYDMDVSIWSSFPKVSIRFERVLNPILSNARLLFNHITAPLASRKGGKLF